MNETEKKEILPRDTAGQDFVKKIGPAGCVLFLALLVLVTAICLTAGKNPVKDYTPAQSSEYYAEHLEELVTELNTRVLPNLDPPAKAFLYEDGTVLISVEDSSFVVIRSALLQYFDESLFTFEAVS